MNVCISLTKLSKSATAIFLACAPQTSHRQVTQLLAQLIRVDVQAVVSVAQAVEVKHNEVAQLIGLNVQLITVNAQPCAADRVECTGS